MQKLCDLSEIIGQTKSFISKEEKSIKTSMICKVKLRRGKHELTILSYDLELGSEISQNIIFWKKSRNREKSGIS